MWPNIFDDVVVIGEKEGGLYKLKGHPRQALVHEAIKPNEVWHKRLAHIYYKELLIIRKVATGLLEL